MRTLAGRLSAAACLALLNAALLPDVALHATTVIPISDAELYRRAHVIVHGVVVSTSQSESAAGLPETVTVISPVEVLKGGLPGDLVLHQPGGFHSDGRFFRLWGRPEYEPGREVIVFAIARAEGGHTTAEMLLGKFDIAEDDRGRRFAVSALDGKEHAGVDVRPEMRLRQRGASISASLDSTQGPREFDEFRSYLRSGARGVQSQGSGPDGDLQAVRQFVSFRTIEPTWGHIKNNRWRYSNGANAGWTLDGTANMTGGGTAEATRALATWTNDPNSTINQYIGGSNMMHLSASVSTGCGWDTCLSGGGGVIGCGGPRGGGSHTWRNETYYTITGGEVWLRCYATLNLYSSTITESVLLHELGHTLGLGHSDQNVSPNDTCRGDESSAIMRSSVQNRTTLGSDDQDAIRWLYGDGDKSCSSPPPPGPGFYSVTPCRIIDTRDPVGNYGGPALAGGATRTVSAAGRCGIPADARSVSINLTVIPAATRGFLTAYAARTARPASSTVNYANGRTRANNAVVGVATDGTSAVSVYNSGAEDVHFLIDVNGFFR
jgi:hypothetical protein